MTQCPRCCKQNVDPIYPHTCTPLALTLADELYRYGTTNNPNAVADELSRLHAENETLRAVLAEREKVLKEVKDAKSNKADQ